MGSLINVDFTNRTVKSASPTAPAPPEKATSALPVEGDITKRTSTLLVCELVELLEAMPPWLPVHIGTEDDSPPVTPQTVGFSEVDDQVVVLL